MFILGLPSWPGIARLVRGSVLAEREQEFVTAAKALGVKEFGIIFRHILPNVVSLLIVSMTLDFATCMLTESTLSYLASVFRCRPRRGATCSTARTTPSSSSSTGGRSSAVSRKTLRPASSSMQPR